MLMSLTNGPVTLSPTQPIGGQLIESLRGRIVRGELAPGMRLSEQDIADAYNLSRQPVREAFIRLAGEGLVEVRPQRGTFVRKISLQEVEASRFVREAVEVEIARLAAVSADPRLVSDLRRIVDEQARVCDRDALAFMRLDERFHRRIAEGAGKAGAWSHLQSIKMNMDRIRYLTIVEFPFRRLMGEHRSIAEALAAGDPGATEAAIRLHLRGVLEDLPLIAAAQPDFFEQETDASGSDNQPPGGNQ
jgi:GntR family transcriptional regulator, rspAB operon transcriptional repressor